MKKNQRNKEGKAEGYLEEYFSNGNVAYKGNYINGIREGYWEYYHFNGKLACKGNHLNDNREGYWEYYFDNGILYLMEYFVI